MTIFKIYACVSVGVCIHWKHSISQDYQIGQLAEVADVKCQIPKPWACSQLEKSHKRLYVLLLLFLLVVVNIEK